MTTDATASLTRTWLPLLVGAAAIGVLLGAYELRPATSRPCGDAAGTGRQACTGDDFGPTLIGAAGLVVLLLVLSAAAASIARRRHALAFTAPLAAAGTAAALTLYLEPTSLATWFAPTAVAVALTAATLTGRTARRPAGVSRST